MRTLKPLQGVMAHPYLAIGALFMSAPVPMRRPRIIGACIVAVLGLSAIVASGAQAQQPEYGQCRELTANSKPKTGKGKFTDENCQELYKNAKGKVQAKGNFEWYPGPPANCIAQKGGRYKDAGCSILDIKNGIPKGKYERQSCYPSCTKYTKTTQVVTVIKALSASNPDPLVICPGGAITYEITGPKTGRYTGAFIACEDVAHGGKLCTGVSTGVPSGEIATTPLNFELGEPALESGVYPIVELKAKNEDEVDIAFSCEGEGYFEVTGPLNEGHVARTYGYNEMIELTEVQPIADHATFLYYETETKFKKKEVTATFYGEVSFFSFLEGAPVEIKVP